MWACYDECGGMADASRPLAWSLQSSGLFREYSAGAATNKQGKPALKLMAAPTTTDIGKICTELLHYKIVNPVDEVEVKL